MDEPEFVHRGVTYVIERYGMPIPTNSLFRMDVAAIRPTHFFHARPKMPAPTPTPVPVSTPPPSSMTTTPGAAAAAAVADVAAYGDDGTSCSSASSSTSSTTAPAITPAASLTTSLFVCTASGTFEAVPPDVKDRVDAVHADAEANACIAMPAAALTSTSAPTSIAADRKGKGKAKSLVLSRREKTRSMFRRTAVLDFAPGPLPTLADRRKPRTRRTLFRQWCGNMLHHVAMRRPPGSEAILTAGEESGWMFAEPGKVELLRPDFLQGVLFCYATLGGLKDGLRQLPLACPKDDLADTYIAHVFPRNGAAQGVGGVQMADVDTVADDDDDDGGSGGSVAGAAAACALPTTAAAASALIPPRPIIAMGVNARLSSSTSTSTSSSSSSSTPAPSSITASLVQLPTTLDVVPSSAAAASGTFDLTSGPSDVPDHDPACIAAAATTHALDAHAMADTSATAAAAAAATAAGAGTSGGGDDAGMLDTKYDAAAAAAARALATAAEEQDAEAAIGLRLDVLDALERSEGEATVLVSRLLDAGKGAIVEGMVSAGELHDAVVQRARAILAAASASASDSTSTSASASTSA